MEDSRRAGALAGFAGAIAGLAGALLPNAGHLAGLSMQFWRGAAIGVAIPMIATAGMMAVRARSRRP